MTLGEALRQRLADWTPRTGRQTLVVAEPDMPWGLSLTADLRDELSCAVWELEVRRVSSAPPDLSLRDWAEQVAGRVTSLTEPLGVLEVDAAKDQALIRSKEASRSKDHLFYYEVLLTGTRTACLRRYRAFETSGHREQCTFAMTHEALAKIALELTMN